MDYLKLIEARKSIREFRDWTITLKQCNDIKNYFSQCKRLIPSIDVELLTFNRDAKEKLSGIAGYQGSIIGAPYYLVILSDEDEYYLENAGYICEDIILKLTDMGLDSCWLTFQDGVSVKEALDIQSQKFPTAIIAYGYGKPEREQRRLDIKTPSNIHIKELNGHIAPKITVEDMVYYEVFGREVNWSEDLHDRELGLAFYAASLSPSFLNRQPYRMIWDQDTVILVEKRDKMTNKMDMKLNNGVVMMNFAVVLSRRRPHDIQWILKAPPKSYELPENFTAVAYCKI